MKMTEEHKRKIGEANRVSLHGRRLSIQHRQSISNGMIGNSNNTGIKFTAIHCERMSIGITLAKGMNGISKDPNYFRISCSKRRAMLRGAKGTFSLKEWESLKQQFNFTCPACGKSEPEIKLTVDHIIPLLKGGSNDIGNIQPLCKPCNSRKNVKIINYKINICKK